jgi:hypothetical protein
MAKQHQKRMPKREQTIAEPDAPDAPALMPDPEPLITLPRSELVGQRRDSVEPAV